MSLNSVIIIQAAMFGSFNFHEIYLLFDKRNNSTLSIFTSIFDHIDYTKLSVVSDILDEAKQC